MLKERYGFIKLGYKGHYSALVMQILLNALGVFVTIMILPLMTRKIIDEGIIAKSLPPIMIYSAISLGAITVYALTSIWVHHIKNRVIDQRIHEICMALYDKAILIPQKDLAANSGYLSMRIFRDVKDFISKLLRFVTNIANSIFGLIIAFSFMIVAFRGMGVLICGALLFYPFLFQKTGKRIAAATTRFNETLARFNETVVDHLQSKVSLVTLGIFDLGRETYDKALRNMLEQNHDLRTQSIHYSVGSTFVSQIIQVLILISTGYAAFASDGSVGKTIAGMTVCTMIMNYLTSFKQVLPQVYALRDYAKRIEETYSMLESHNAPKHAGGKTIELVKGTLSVGKTPLLGDVNLSVAAGHSLHLKGPNGSGKSTLGMALAGLQLGLKGSVATPSRENISYLASAPTLINIPLRDYAAYLKRRGEQPETLEKLWQQFDFPALEEQTARKLSLGETQKLQLLLALAKNPDFLVFDECFSGIDKASLPLIKTTLEERQEHKGYIFIDHRADVFNLCRSELDLGAATQEPTAGVPS